MLSLPATLLWYAFLIVVLWAFQRLTHWLTRLNIFSLFLGFLILRHGLTVPFDHTVNQWYAGIDVSPAAYRRYYVSLVLMWTCLLVGVWVARSFIGGARVDPARFRTQLRRNTLPAGINGLFVPLLLCGLILILLYQAKFNGNVWKLLTGAMSSAEYRAMRDSFGVATHFSAGLGSRLASVVRFGLFPTLICTLYFLSRRGGRWLVLFVATLGLGLLVGLLSGQKGASLFLLISLALAIYYRSGRIRLHPTNWRIWALAAFGVCAISFLYRLQYPEQTFGWAFRATTYRLTSEADRSLQLYFQVYPDIQSFLHGRSSSLVNGLLGIKMDVDQLPERFIPTYYLGPEYLNTWNGAFIGVAWADFGYWGVAIESLFVGWLLQAYARWFSRARKTALVMGTQVGLLMASTRLSEVALSASLLTFGLLSSFVVYHLVRAPRRSVRSDHTTVTIAHAHPSSRS
jgi:oligosaccharide repeat unit polymerase